MFLSDIKRTNNYSTQNFTLKSFLDLKILPRYWQQFHWLQVMNLESFRHKKNVKVLKDLFVLIVDTQVS